MKVFFVTMLCAGILPGLMMHFIMRSLAQDAPRFPNHQGQLVHKGLGIIWPFFSLGMVIAWLILFALGITPLTTVSWFVLILVGSGVMMGAFTFGLIDDALGGNTHARGFKGHLNELVHGRLTTGLIKMIGIGLVSVAGAALIGLFQPLSEPLSMGVFILRVLLIALAANLLNLFDLRPVRAHKVYLFILMLWALIVSISRVFAAIDVLYVVVISVIPLLVVWRDDARALGMQGDAGSNAMGAFLGYLMAACFPPGALLGTVVILLALNLASERWSFSTIIENNTFLRQLDMLGREDYERPSKEE